MFSDTIGAVGSANVAPAAADGPGAGSENKRALSGVAADRMSTAAATPTATASPPAGAREPGPAELDDRRGQLQDLAWGWTRQLAGLGPDDGPVSLHEPAAGPQWQLAQLAVLRRLRRILDGLVDSTARTARTARTALQLGASHVDVATAADISVQTARKRWPPAASRPAPADQ